MSNATRVNTPTSSTHPSDFDTLPFSAVTPNHQACRENWGGDLRKCSRYLGRCPLPVLGDGALGLHKIIWTGLGWLALEAALPASQDRRTDGWKNETTQVWSRGVLACVQESICKRCSGSTELCSTTRNTEGNLNLPVDCVIVHVSREPTAGAVGGSDPASRGFSFASFAVLSPSDSTTGSKGGEVLS